MHIIRRSIRCASYISFVKPKDAVKIIYVKLPKENLEREQ